MASPSVSRLQILLAALLFSTGGTVVKAVALTPWQIAAFRSLIAGVALALVMPRWRRGWNGRVVLVGLAYAATMVLFVVANRLTTAANTIFLQATAPLYLLALGPLVLGEKIGRRQIFVGVVLACGMGLFFYGLEPPQRTAPDPPLGNLLGACAGMTWALTLTGLRWLGRTEPRPGTEPAGAAVVVGNLIAGVGCLALVFPVAGAATRDWLWVLYLGLFQIGLAYVFMTFGVRRVSAFETSLLLILEPVGSVGWAWWIHGERPGRLALVGCALILAATAFSALSRGRRRDPNPAAT